MENHESSASLEQWTLRHSVLLEPPEAWKPNLTVARARFEARRVRRRQIRRYWLAAATGAILACIALATMQPSRVYAQTATGKGWYWQGMYRIRQTFEWFTFVRSGPVLLPSLAEVLKFFNTQPLAEADDPLVVSDSEHAARLVGFIPQFPSSDVLSKSPRLSVLGPRSYRTVVRTEDIERALAAQGVPDQAVPISWDGIQIKLQVGATIKAEWTDVPDESSGRIEWSELTLTQGAPPAITTPAGFDLGAFTVATLRAAGMRNRNDALVLGGLTTTAPALLLGYKTSHHIGVRLANLYAYSPIYTRPATLIEEFEMPLCGAQSNCPQVERITLVWSAPGQAPSRVYVLSGAIRNPSDMFGLDVAGALTNLIDVATSIDNQSGSLPSGTE